MHFLERNKKAGKLYLVLYDVKSKSIYAAVSEFINLKKIEKKYRKVSKFYKARKQLEDREFIKKYRDKFLKTRWKAMPKPFIEWLELKENEIRNEKSKRIKKLLEHSKKYEEEMLENLLDTDIFRAKVNAYKNFFRKKINSSAITPFEILSLALSEIVTIAKNEKKQKEFLEKFQNYKTKKNIKIYLLTFNILYYDLYESFKNKDQNNKIFKHITKNLGVFRLIEMFTYYNHLKNMYSKLKT
jgi:hypothetical protein